MQLFNKAVFGVVIAVLAAWVYFAEMVFPVQAQVVVPGTHPSAFQYSYQTVPGAMPTSLTCLVGVDVACVKRLTVDANYTDPYICIADVTATGQNVTIQDGQGTPVPWVNNALGSGGSPTTWTWVASTDSTCRRMPFGVYVQAGSSGVTYYLSVKYGNKAF